MRSRTIIVPTSQPTSNRFVFAPAAGWRFAPAPFAPGTEEWNSRVVIYETGTTATGTSSPQAEQFAYEAIDVAAGDIAEPEDSGARPVAVYRMGSNEVHVFESSNGATVPSGVAVFDDPTPPNGG